MSVQDELKIGIAQISPILLNKKKTTIKIMEYIQRAAESSCQIVVFGEALLPGYPFWIAYTNGSEFESKIQKEIHAKYLLEAVDIENGDLDSICQLAKKYNIAVYLGTVERAANRGGHSLYCSLVFIDNKGQIKSVHRKLQPTFEERLAWAAGDGAGLRVHELESFKLGGLNCWENWMPLSRTALYAQGENVHVAVWPGSDENTKDITRFIAKESRSYVISVSGIMRKSDFDEDIPHLEYIIKSCPNLLANGGSCIASPDGNWLIEPAVNEELLLTATISLRKIFEERHNFDLAGHYSRSDITKLVLDRTRQSIINIIE